MVCWREQHWSQRWSGFVAVVEDEEDGVVMAEVAAAVEEADEKRFEDEERIPVAPPVSSSRHQICIR